MRKVIAWVNFRPGPGLDHERTDILTPGTLVEVLARKPHSATRTWIQVRLADGRVGWIAAWYTRVHRP
jgi:uncharacterized protein YgiM (DUF1202 family)